VFLYWTYLPHLRENMQLLSFWIQLTSLKMMFSSSIHLPADNKNSLFFMAKSYFMVYMHHIFLIHSWVLGHLGYFHSFTIVKSPLLLLVSCLCFMFHINPKESKAWSSADDYNEIAYQISRESKQQGTEYCIIIHNMRTFC
jgi:hypothetical protein